MTTPPAMERTAIGGRPLPGFASHRLLPGLCLLMLVIGIAAGAFASEPMPRRFLGLSLAEALRSLQADGVALVFTSLLVRPEMQVEAEPTAREPALLLDQLLAPHGLRASEEEGTLVVVKRVAGEGRGHWLSGEVRSQKTGEPLVRATVRIVEPEVEVKSGLDGRFEAPALEPGLYTLEVRSPGYIVHRRERVLIVAGQQTTLVLDLKPVPLVSEEIVVRPSRLSLLREQPAAPLSLSRSDIENLPHLGGDVFRTLSLLPGIAANDATAQFSIHGGRRDEVQILLDGQELYDAHHLKDFDNALSSVASEGLASISLSTGAFPVRHGDRMSGVLDMTTTTPSGPVRTRLSLSVLNALAASAGTFNRGRGGWLASARRGSLDLVSRIFGPEDPRFWDLFGKLEYDLGSAQRLRLNLLRAGDRLDFSENLEDESKSFDTDYESSYAWLTHLAPLGERVLVESAVSLSGLDRDRRGVENEEELDFTVIDRRELEVLGLTHSWDWSASPRHELSGGFELRRYDAEYDYRNRAERDFILSTPLVEPRSGVPRFAAELRGEYLGAWMSERLSPHESLVLELGLRYDRQTLTDDTLVSPRINLAWQPSAVGILRAGWGHFFQTQRPYELLVEDGETDFFPAERSEHWVLGYEHLFGDRGAAPLRALRVEVFRREVSAPRPRYENLFEPLNAFPEVEQDRVRIAPERSNAEGVELFLRGAAGPRVDWWVNYTYSIAEDRLDGERVRRQIDQPQALNLDLNWRLGRSTNLNLAWRFHTGWPTTPVSLETRLDDEGEEELVPVLGPLNSERLSDYHRLDVRISRTWQLRSGELTLFADIQNAYDRENLAGFDMAIDDEEEPPLEIEAERWHGIFPSLGVAWEF